MSDVNQYYMPINAPVTNDRPEIGFDFDSGADRGMVRTFSIRNLAVGSAQIQDASITDAKIVTLSASKILAGTVTVGINIGTAAGSAFVKLDGANNRIVVNDGTTNRIVIGNV